MKQWCDVNLIEKILKQSLIYFKLTNLKNNIKAGRLTVANRGFEWMNAAEAPSRLSRAAATKAEAYWVIQEDVKIINPTILCTRHCF